MASLKKPVSCPQCKGYDLKKIMITHTAPHYEGWICLECIQDPEVAIYPNAFIIHRPKRAKGVCRDCGRTPEQIEFKKGKNQCIECARAAMTDWKSRNKEHLRKYRSTPEFKQKRNMSVRKVQTASVAGWLRCCMQHILKPAMRERIKKGHSSAILIVGIDFNYLMSLYKQQAGKCALSGLLMTHRRRDPYSISIDRIDSDKGYISGNVQLVCKFINLGKSRHSNSEVKSLLDTYFHTRLLTEGFVVKRQCSTCGGDGHWGPRQDPCFPCSGKGYELVHSTPQLV